MLICCGVPTRVRRHLTPPCQNVPQEKNTSVTYGSSKVDPVTPRCVELALLRTVSSFLLDFFNKTTLSLSLSVPRGENMSLNFRHWIIKTSSVVRRKTLFAATKRASNKERISLRAHGERPLSFIRPDGFTWRLLHVASAPRLDECPFLRRASGSRLQ